jgi:hypothetical protein
MCCQRCVILNLCVLAVVQCHLQLEVVLTELVAKYNTCYIITPVSSVSQDTTTVLLYIVLLSFAVRLCTCTLTPAQACSNSTRLLLLLCTVLT